MLRMNGTSNIDTTRFQRAATVRLNGSRIDAKVDNTAAAAPRFEGRRWFYPEHCSVFPNPRLVGWQRLSPFGCGNPLMTRSLPTSPRQNSGSENPAVCLWGFDNLHDLRSDKHAVSLLSSGFFQNPLADQFLDIQLGRAMRHL